MVGVIDYALIEQGTVDVKEGVRHKDAEIADEGTA